MLESGLNELKGLLEKKLPPLKELIERRKELQKTFQDILLRMREHPPETDEEAKKLREQIRNIVRAMKEIEIKIENLIDKQNGKTEKEKQES